MRNKNLIIIGGVVVFALSIAGYLAYALSTQTWDFTTASNYTLYKGNGTAEPGTTESGNNEIYIDTDNIVKLKVLSSAESPNDTIAEYNTGYDAGATVDKYVSTAAGIDADLVLTKTGATYDTPGTFTSRVFEWFKKGNKSYEL